MVTVKVLQEAVFVDDNFRALPPAQPGDVIQIADGWYANSMVESGFVELAQPSAKRPAPAPAPAVEEEAPAPEAKPAVQEKPRVRRSS